MTRKREPPQSLTGRVLAHVERRGEVANGQVVAALGKFIDSRVATTVGRRRVAWHRRENGRALGDLPQDESLDFLVTSGRRWMVNAVLSRLARTGKIRRVRKGVYAPAFRLFDGGEKSA